MKKARTDRTDKNFVEIDPLALDREWVNQPRLYLQFASELADANRELDEAKSNLDIVKADLDQNIRSDPEQFGLDKVTEASITSTLLTQPEYKEAMTLLIESRHKREILAAAVAALDHRKKALEKLVDLHMSGYYASPRASGDSREAMSEVERKSTRRSLPKRS